MRMIDHFIHGGTAGLAATRKGAVMDPNNGGQQAEVVLGGADALDRAHRLRRTEPARLVEDQPAGQRHPAHARKLSEKCLRHSAT